MEQVLASMSTNGGLGIMQNVMADTDLSPAEKQVNLRMMMMMQMAVMSGNSSMSDVLCEGC